MINDLDLNLCPLQPFELYTNQNLYSEQYLELESLSKKHRVSSQCLLINKKIRHRKSRPSFLRIEQEARDVRLYNIVSSQTNLDNLEIAQNKAAMKSN